MVHGSVHVCDKARLKLDSCHKGKDESICMFGERIRQLCFRAYPSPNYSANAREEQAMKVFIEGLPDMQNLKLTMKLQNFKVLQEAVEYATRFEVLSQQSEDETDQVRQCEINGNCSQILQNKLNVEKKTLENSPCFSCGHFGHWRPQCPNRRRPHHNVETEDSH